MLSPLKSNVVQAENLLKKLKGKYKLMEMAQTIFISSKLLLLHANDLLDQNIIEKGGFEPQYTRCDLPSIIKQMVKLVRSTLMQKPIAIQCDVSKCLNFKKKLLCDGRRL